MSSSKIIKQANRDCISISEFSFGNIGQLGALLPVPVDTGSFVPFNSPVPECEVEEEVDLGPPPIEISEEELNQKITGAFNDGLKEGKELAERGLINVFRTLRASSEMIHNLREKILRESEDELLNLIMLVARKVVIHEIAQDRSILAAVVNNAISGLSAREEITVRINPDDYLLVTSGRDELLHRELLSERLLLKPDPTVAAGFCLVDTDMGTIDASLEGQMDQIYRSLLEQRTTTAVEEQ